MKLNNVHHIAVNTLDIETSIAFYRDMFGFEEEKRADMGNCILVYLKISPDSYMELFDLRNLLFVLFRSKFALYILYH